MVLIVFCNSKLLYIHYCFDIYIDYISVIEKRNGSNVLEMQAFHEKVQYAKAFQQLLLIKDEGSSMVRINCLNINHSIVKKVFYKCTLPQTPFFFISSISVIIHLSFHVIPRSPSSSFVLRPLYIPLSLIKMK